MKIIKIIIDDIKGDFKFLSDLVQGKAKIQEKNDAIVKEFKSEYSKGGFFINYFKENWFWIMFAILTFSIGLWFGSIYFGNKCNSIIVEKVTECMAFYEGNPILNPFTNLTIS